MTLETTHSGASAVARASSLALLCSNPLTVAAILVLSIIAALALLAPVLPLADPAATNLSNRLLPPWSDGHLLGTDQLGRDLLSRLIWGTRSSIAVGASATFIAAVAGSLIGLVAGYAGGVADSALMRGVDLVMAFPYILLALAIVAVLGPGLLNALYAIAIVNIPFFARNVRGITRGLSRREFVDAARLSGASNTTILFGEVLPNVLPIIVVTVSTTLGWMILETAGLSFLGLGAQPPQADLGSMLGEGRAFLFTAPYVSAIPGVMIFALVISINLIGDGVRDALDPRLRTGMQAAPGAATTVESFSKDRSGTTDALLDVVGLRVVFRTKGRSANAVSGVDWTLRKGERLGVVGESGSGKSVSALAITRLVPTPPGAITGGSVRLDGEDVLRASRRRLRNIRGARIAYIFQDPTSALHPLIPIGEQIAETVRMHRNVSQHEAHAATLELLDQVRLHRDRYGAYPHELSGGMKQRVAIAIAIANKPEVIVADEPTTALDVTVQADVLHLLAELCEQHGTALLFISHDFGVVSELCERVAVMYAGRIMEVGPTDAVLAHPANPYTSNLIACVPVLGTPDRPLHAIEGQPPPIDSLPPGCAFADRCPIVEDRCRVGDIDLQPLGPGRASRCVKPLWTAPEGTSA